MRREVREGAGNRDGEGPVNAGDVLKCDSAVSTHLKIVVEKHRDGYVAYPLGIKGVVVGQGDTYEEALEDVKSAIKFHLETFGETLSPDESVIDAFIVDATVAV